MESYRIQSLIHYRRPPPPPKPLNTLRSSSPKSASPSRTFLAALGFLTVFDTHLDERRSPVGVDVGGAAFSMRRDKACVLCTGLRLALGERTEVPLRLLAGDAVVGDSMMGMSAMSVLTGCKARGVFGVCGVGCGVSSGAKASSQFPSVSSNSCRSSSSIVDLCASKKELTSDARAETLEMLISSIYGKWSALL